MTIFNKKIKAALAAIALLGGAAAVDANHAWGPYHWGRTANPFTLQLGDNVSTQWDGYLTTTSSAWSASSVLDTTVKPGKTTPRTCRPTTGRVEVCNDRYGWNGWLGIAQIWVSGDHIVKGTTRVNDTYFATARYNKPAWKTYVMCQEVGHTLGLAHQDETFANANLGSCMDYTNDPDGTIAGQPDNRLPNQHDYDELEAIYTHLDGVKTILTSIRFGNARLGDVVPIGAEQDVSGRDVADADVNDPSAWGRVEKKDARGRPSRYVRELGRGERIVTFVIWAE